MFEALRHFLLVVEHRSFTEAARHAHLSQPALSASIKKLEGRLGARLLHRGPSGAEPTAAGLALVPRAQAALAAVDDAVRAVAEVEGLARGEVRIGAGATACTYLLPPYVAAFRARHPGVVFRLREAETETVRDAVRAGALDLGLVTAGGLPDDDPALVREPWREDPLVLVGAPGVDPRGAPFVTFPRGSPIRALLDRHFPEASVVMELGSIAAVKANVHEGIGIALVSRAAVGRELADGRLREISDARTPILRTLALVHRGESRMTPASAAYRALLLGQPVA